MMISFPRRAVLASSLCVIAAAGAGRIAAGTECAPARMVKIVRQNMSPGVDPNSFAASPKTIYRLGSRYGRLEEEPDTEGGAHLLTVVNEPDVWLANLTDRTGRHIVDAGPSLKFHAPILWSADLPVRLRDLEYGCEVAFMKERASRPPAQDRLEGVRVDRYEMDVGPFLVTLYVGRSDGKPRALDLKKGPELLFAVRYLLYEEREQPDLSLFDTPRGITFRKG